MREDEKYLIQLKEDINIELKESSNKIPDNLYETYSSFSNTKGGTIYLGIKEGKTNIITGLNNAEEQRRVLITSLHSKNKVSYCSISDDDIKILDINGKKIIRFEVKEAPLEAKPVYINRNLSKSFTRIGDGDFLMTEDDIASLLVKKKGVDFDILPNHLGIDDTRLDLDSLKEFRKRMDDVYPNSIFKNLSNHDFLFRIGALTLNNGKEVLRNGAVLFFGYINDIIQICPNYFLDYQENLSGSTRWDKRIVTDDFSFNGNIFNFFSLVSKELIKNLPNPFKTDGVTNINGEDIKRSVIEGMVNAITNCDFNMLPGVVIKKKNDEITFINSGDIPVGKEQAISGGITDSVNKNIMNYFRLLQVSDRAGTGVPSIFEVFRSYGFITPNLTVSNNPKRTTLILNYTNIKRNTTYYEEKIKILSYLLSHNEGASCEELSKVIGMKNTTTNKIISELLLQNSIKTNDKKTKGKRYFSI